MERSGTHHSNGNLICMEFVISAVEIRYAPDVAYYF